MIKKLTIILLLLNILSIQNINSQTRGASPGEIYISTDWYAASEGIQYGIFHSTTHGQYIYPMYNNLQSPPPNEMKVGRILGDATPGALYNWGNNELWVSFDYGESWEFREGYPDNARFLSGQDNGNISKRIGAILFHSQNFGSSFAEITNPISSPINASGLYLGEFFGFNGEMGVQLLLDHTINYGSTNTEIQIPIEVALHQIGGYYPQISRGTEPGELYLVSWWPDYHYKIFHSIDTGYTWTEQYESEYIDTFDWRVSYTAGRAACSFYVIRSRIAPPAYDHTWLYIDYSSDCGQTFTTYFHDLVPDFTGIENTPETDINCNSYPNPFSNHTTIEFSTTNLSVNAMLCIYTVNGILIKQFPLFNQTSIKWDATNRQGEILPNGIYFYHIVDDHYFYPFNKLIINH